MTLEYEIYEPLRVVFDFLGNFLVDVFESFSMKITIFNDWVIRENNTLD